MNDLFSGAYVNVNSPVHRLDSRIKLLFFILAVVLTLLSKSCLVYAVHFVLLTACTIISKIKISYLFSSLKRIWIFALVIFVMNAVFYEGKDVLFSLSMIDVSKQGVLQGMHIVLNIIFIFLWSGLYLSVTSPMEMMRSIKFYLSPLKLIHIKTDNLTLIISISIQFIPLLLEEASNIKKAQIARGAEFESKNILKKARSILPLVVPIFISAFKRADEMSQAFEARGYKGDL